MAGVDDGFSGEARLTAGFTVGYLTQEPRSLTIRRMSPATWPTAWLRPRQILDRFNEVCEAMGDPDADFDKLLAEQADLQDKIDAANAWDLDRTLDIAMDALRLPPGDTEVATLSGGERRRRRPAGCCCRAPTCSCSTSPPTTSTPNRWPGWSEPCRTIPAPWWP